MSKGKRSIVDDYMNGRVMYGGIPLPRHVVITDLRAKGCPESAIGFWTGKPEVVLTNEEAAFCDKFWNQVIQEENEEANDIQEAVPTAQPTA